MIDSAILIPVDLGHKLSFNHIIGFQTLIPEIRVEPARILILGTLMNPISTLHAIAHPLSKHGLRLLTHFIDLFDLGYDLFDLGYDLFDLGYDIFDLGYDLLDLGYDLLDLGYDLFDLGYDLFSISCIGFWTFVPERNQLVETGFSQLTKIWEGDTVNGN